LFGIFGFGVEELELGFVLDGGIPLGFELFIGNEFCEPLLLDDELDHDKPLGLLFPPLPGTALFPCIWSVVQEN